MLTGHLPVQESCQFIDHTTTKMNILQMLAWCFAERRFRQCARVKIFVEILSHAVWLVHNAFLPFGRFSEAGSVSYTHLTLPTNIAV